MTSSPSNCCVEVYGCQMNVRDGETVAGILRSSGFGIVSDPREADVVLVVTCAVREHAEVRALGRISQLGGMRGPGGKRPVLVVCGCVAQEHGRALLDRLDTLDLVVGPDGYHRLPDLIREGARAAVTDLHGEEYENVVPVRTEFPRAYVTAARGCDNRCSYCIVPAVRGHEHSRDAESIVREVDGLREQGYGEVTLLGQNVNSYRCGDIGFPRLLEMVSDAAGGMRVRFVTSHPRDFGGELADVMASRDNVCRQLHLPVQSGSDRILGLMNRGYTREYYLDLVDSVRERVEGLVLSTDAIAGFPGETEEEFGETVSLLEEVRFDYAFLFRYSERSGTAACGMPDPVPEETRLERLGMLQDIQRRITVEKSRELVGEVREVLVTGPARKPGQQAARTEGNRLVVLEGTGFAPGERLAVRITAADGWTHFGVPEGTR